MLCQFVIHKVQRQFFLWKLFKQKKKDFDAQSVNAKYALKHFHIQYFTEDKQK